MIRIGIVDDHPMYRLGLKKALEREADLDVQWELGSPANLHAVIRRTPVDVILMDLFMGGGKDGIAATREVSDRWPQVKVVVISASIDERTVLASTRAGAAAFLPKAMSVSEMVASIRRLASTSGPESGSPTKGPTKGKVSPRVLLDAQGDFVSGPASRLSYRQQEVLQEMRLGRTNREIAAHLGVSISTVNKHVHQILGALKVRNRTLAVSAADRGTRS